MGLIAAQQILARFWQQVIGGKFLAIFFEDHDIAVFRRPFAVVDHGEGMRRIAERGMGGNVVHQLLANIDPAPVPQTVQIRLAAHQHEFVPTKIRRHNVCRGPSLIKSVHTRSFADPWQFY